MRTTYPRQKNRFWPNLFLMFMLFLAIASCQTTADTQTDSLKEIESTLVLFSSSLAKADTATLSKICSSGFILLDEGKFYTKSELYNSITSVLSTGSMIREPYDIHIDTSGDFAWTYYNVKGEFQSSDAFFKLAFIESAILKRSERGWLIVQASTMPSATD